MGMTELKIRKIGDSVGVILPEELLAHLNVAVGQSVSVTKTPHGIALAAVSPQMDIARAVMSRRKRALRALAR
jgi:putative addiction module antidote